MPYTARQNRFFRMCEHSPSSAYKKCPPKAQAAKMAHEGVKATSKRKKRTVPRRDKNGYY